MIELGAGAALMCIPSAMLELLLGPGFDTSAAVTLGRTAGQPVGVALWPAVVLHAVMVAWCITVVLRKLTPLSETAK